MAAQAGPPGPAIPESVEAGRAMLADRLVATAGADRVLGDIVQGACAAVAAVHRRLDAIETEIAAWLQSAAPLDTAPGAREFQRFLLATQRELTAIITESRHDAAARGAALQAVRERYQPAAE